MKRIGKLLIGFVSVLLFDSRTALAILWAICATSVSAQGPAGRSCNTVDPPVSHWSADVKVGSGVNFGGSAEYALNPFAGVGFQTLYGIRQNALDLLGYGSLNLSNLTDPFRTGIWKKTNIFANVGGGIHQTGFNLSHVAFDLGPAGSTSLLVLAGLNSEYNLTDALALEIGGDLLYSLEMRVNVSLGLRYKFGVSDKKHARNISMYEYRPQPSPIIIRQTVWAGYDAVSLSRLEALEKSNADLEVNIQSTTDKIKAYKELLASQAASQAATKAVGMSAPKPGLAVKPPLAVAPPLLRSSF